MDYKSHKLHEVRFGNLFDGDLTYSFIGFNSCRRKKILLKQKTKVSILLAISVFLHSPYEIMNIARGLPWTDNAYEFESYSIEIITSPDFKTTTTISQRKCRFHDESNLEYFDVYTKGICLMECRIKLSCSIKLSEIGQKFINFNFLLQHMKNVDAFRTFILKVWVCVA